MSDLISRADAIDAVRKSRATDPFGWAVDAIKALPSAETPTMGEKHQLSAETPTDYISRADAIEALEDNKSDWDNDYNRPIEKDIQAIKALPSADRPTVIRSRTFMPTKDFKEWAKRIREVNPNAVVIPCDAEVVSAEAVQGWIPCSERLPSESDYYLVTNVNAFDEKEVCIIWFAHKVDYGISEWREITDGDTVLAWMPLPKPYKGGEK